MHTPGVITALVQLAPPFSGIITGWSSFAVAWFSISNKILTKQIVQEGELRVLWQIKSQHLLLDNFLLRFLNKYNCPLDFPAIMYKQSHKIRYHKKNFKKFTLNNLFFKRTAATTTNCLHSAYSLQLWAAPSSKCSVYSFSVEKKPSTNSLRKEWALSLIHEAVFALLKQPR
uniref:Secreted protein n=1 Tax=Heterorhabditis bacteriophora TaxID=37862 RepID=A0A1I7X9N6_HETBA